MSSTSSSSDDEDFSKFASCAVSADQIEKDAQIEAKKRAVRSSQRPISSAARPAAASTQQQQQDGGSDEPMSTGLDLISEKIAAALDAILARELEEPDSTAAKAAATTPKDKAEGSKPSTKSVAAAAGGEADSTPCATPTQANPAGIADITASPPAAAAATQDADDDCTGVQLFRTVPKGTPCVIQQDSTDIWGPLAAGQDHQQQQKGTAAGFGSASIPQKQPLRDVIPRLSLAARSRQASKRKYEATLAALAVDGAALHVAAAAAGYPCSRSTGGKSSGSSSSSKGGGKASTTTAAWVKGWKRMKGQRAEGFVVDAKEWVPYDVRAAKLLGTQPVC